jgi:hypothetical protein
MDRNHAVSVHFDAVGYRPCRPCGYLFALTRLGWSGLTRTGLRRGRGTSSTEESDGS